MFDSALFNNYETTIIDNASLHSLVDFTRASAATLIDPDGVLQSVTDNVTRFDYSDTNYPNGALLVEGTRTNLLEQYQDITQSVWTKSNTTATNSTTLTSTATPFAFSELYNLTSVTSAVTYTQKYKVKYNGQRYVQIIGPATIFGLGYVNFDLQSGTITASLAGTGAFSGFIVDNGDGVYTIGVKATCILTSGSGRLALEFIDTSTSLRGSVYNGDGIKGIFIYGSQMEVGTFPSSDIITTTTALARADEVFTLPITDIENFNPEEGSILVDFVANGLTANYQTIYGLSSASVSNGVYLRIRGDNNKLEAAVFNTSVQQTGMTLKDPAVVGTRYKVANSYKLNDFAACVNGGTVLTDTGGSIPTVTGLYIGSAGASTRFAFSHISKLIYVPYRLSNAQLQAWSAI